MNAEPARRYVAVEIRQGKTAAWYIRDQIDRVMVADHRGPGLLRFTGQDAQDQAESAASRLEWRSSAAQMRRRPPA